VKSGLFTIVRTANLSDNRVCFAILNPAFTHIEEHCFIGDKLGKKTGTCFPALEVLEINSLQIIVNVFPDFPSSFALNLLETTGLKSIKYPHTCYDGLCGLVVRVPGSRSRCPGSNPGATRFPEK
jgi:hypothetical protein